MKKFLCKFLCKLGIHKWRVFYINLNNSTGLDICCRCYKKRKWGPLSV